LEYNEYLKVKDIFSNAYILVVVNDFNIFGSTVKLKNINPFNYEVHKNFIHIRDKDFLNKICYILSLNETKLYFFEEGILTFTDIDNNCFDIWEALIAWNIKDFTNDRIEYYNDINSPLRKIYFLYESEKENIERINKLFIDMNLKADEMINFERTKMFCFVTNSHRTFIDSITTNEQLIVHLKYNLSISNTLKLIAPIVFQSDVKHFITNLLRENNLMICKFEFYKNPITP
jgi:hypothetical protein